jgi:hypothetical protein
VCVHLWGFDRFRCLRWWDKTHSPGAFKRFMTVRPAAYAPAGRPLIAPAPQYCYLLTPPLIFVYSVATAYLKFQEGFLIIGDDGPCGPRLPRAHPLTPERAVYPKPTILWSHKSQRWLSPLNFVLAAIWALELWVPCASLLPAVLTHPQHDAP